VLWITKWFGITIFSILNLRGAALCSLSNLKGYKKLPALRAAKQQTLTCCRQVRSVESEKTKVRSFVRRLWTNRT